AQPDAVQHHEARPASLAKLLRREPGRGDAVEILGEDAAPLVLHRELERLARALHADPDGRRALGAGIGGIADQVHEHVIQGVRKSTRLNSSHEWISYAVFCLKKKT